MSRINTFTERSIFKKAQDMCLVPFVYDETVKDYVLGQNVYDISAIIGDTISLGQDSGDTTQKENEFTGLPLVENTEIGEWKFSAQCIDLQNVVMREIFGATTSDVQGLYALPSDNVTIYALIRIRFKSTNTPDVYLPKVLLNSQLAIKQIRSQSAIGTINGTALSVRCAVKDPTSENLLAEFSHYRDTESSYTFSTPILFCPKSHTPLFLHHYDGANDRYVFSVVNFSLANGANVEHNISVALGQRGAWQYETIQ